MTPDWKTLTLSLRPRMMCVQIREASEGEGGPAALLSELGAALTLAELNPRVSTLVISGASSCFCRGLEELECPQEGNDASGRSHIRRHASRYWELLGRFAQSPKWIVGTHGGHAGVGSLGFLAACDLVLCAPNASFNFQGVIPGLMPESLVPHLMRRIGFHKAYLYTLTKRLVEAPEALALGLVDELSENLEASLDRLPGRLRRLKPKGLAPVREFFERMCGLEGVRGDDKAAIRLLTSHLEGPRNLNVFHAFPGQN